MLPVTELESIVSRLSSSACPINSDVKQLIHRSNLSKLVSIYQSVMIQKQNISSFANDAAAATVSALPPSSQRQPSTSMVTASSVAGVTSKSSIPCLNQSSCDLMQEIISILQEEVRIEKLFTFPFDLIDHPFQSAKKVFLLSTSLDINE